MHTTIGALVYAMNADEAKGDAESIFEKLCGDAGPFDYFTIYEDGILRLNSRKGTKELETLMGFMKDHFMASLRDLRGSFARMTDEEVFLQDMVRWNALQIGKYEGMGIHLYGPSGEGLRNPGDVEIALANLREAAAPKGVLDWTPQDADETKDRNHNIWIVLADVHF